MKRLLKNQSGAVTVDWVVLAGALVLLSGGVVAAVRTSLENSSSTLNQEVLDSVQDPTAERI